MCRLETISTADVAPHRKVRYWNNVVSEAVAEAAADPLDTGTFAGTLKYVDLGTIRFAEVNGGASSVRRLPSPARSSYFILGLVLSGEIVCRSNGSDIRVGPGDFWLYSPAVSADMLLPQPATLLSVCIPRDHITRYIGCPEALASVVMPGNAGPCALASSYLRDFWSRTENELSANLALRFGEIALQMVASSYAALPEAQPERSTLLAQHRMRIRAYIEEHLSDPDLTPQSIAENLRVTRGYVHRLFSGKSESPARYILRRRLEESHRALSDRMQAGRSVTTIAFEHGFNSLPHFCRAFRAQYGITPRELQLKSSAAPAERCRSVD